MTGQYTFLFSDFFKYALVIGRFAGLVVFLPGIGEPHIPGRIKALLVLALTVGLTPAVDQPFPPSPSTPLGMGVMLAGEIFIGFFLATVVRFIISALDLAGTLVGFQTGLANVFTLSTVSSQQSALTAAFLGLCAVTFIFVSDLHFLFLETLLQSYKIWQPASLVKLDHLSEDVFTWLLIILSKSFMLGLQLAAPIIVTSFLLMLAGGIIGRLIPQIQVFFVFQPLQIALGLGVLFICLEVSMKLFQISIEETLSSLLSGGYS